VAQGSRSDVLYLYQYKAEWDLSAGWSVRLAPRGRAEYHRFQGLVMIISYIQYHSPLFSHTSTISIGIYNAQPVRHERSSRLQPYLAPVPARAIRPSFYFPARMYDTSAWHNLCLWTEYSWHDYDSLQLLVDHFSLYLEYSALERARRTTTSEIHNPRHLVGYFGF
jgi:hypothetical protein